MKKTIAILLAAACLSGCRTVNVNVIQPWEGRYDSMEALRAKTEGVELESGKSVWVLSNDTLYNILKKKEN